MGTVFTFKANSIYSQAFLITSYHWGVTFSSCLHKKKT